MLDGKKKEERKIQNNIAEIIKGAKNSINSEKVDNNYIDLSELKKSRFQTMYVIFYSVDSQKRNMPKNIFHRFLLKKCSLF